MCGIAGFVEFAGAPSPMLEREARVHGMGERLAHRGPDEATTLHWEGVSLAFRRLSINDLEHGSQPFHSPDGAITALVNGELYNHRDLRPGLSARHLLRTGSDCEVLPFLYDDLGEAAFERINGMFAAVLLDRRARRLLLVRDRLGIKPLFYARCPTSGRIVFGSELKALLAHPAVPRRFDWRAALQFSSWPTAGQEQLASGFVGIDCVPPGGVVRIDLDSGACTVDRFWRLEQAAARLEPPLRSETPGRFRDLLADSVRARLMADVGVGLFLSGGIDSVAIAALAARHRRLPTFSVWNRATRASGDAAASRQAATVLGLPNHAVRVALEDAPDPEAWRNLLWACELHSITAEQWFKFRLHAYARALDPSLKVILLGQGADEFLGGYLQRLTGIRRAEGREAWDAVDRALQEKRAHNAVAAAGVATAYRPWFEAGWLDAAALAGPAASTWDRYRSHFRTNLDYHLWHEDRTSAAHGIENRVPFLDHRLLEFLASIPHEQHARWFTDKHLLRSAVADLVPAGLCNRPKGYFFYGSGQLDAYRMIASLLRAEDGALIEQALSGSRASDGPLTGTGLRTMAARVLDDPALRGITPLLFLVNMGVLADLAAQIETVPPIRAGVPPELLDDSAVQDALDEEQRAGTGIESDGVYALSSGISLLELRRAGPDDGPVGSLLIAEHDRLLEEVSDPLMARFLLAIDGRRSLADIAGDEGLSLEALHRALPEALELSLLARVD